MKNKRVDIYEKLRKLILKKKLVMPKRNRSPFTDSGHLFSSELDPYNDEVEAKKYVEKLKPQTTAEAKSGLKGFYLAKQCCCYFKKGKICRYQGKHKICDHKTFINRK